jgi:hypothetical protein
MEPSGLIFAALDCDADAIEEWNRWYDLEHVPPNVSMPGVMLGSRYVATPELYAARRGDPASPFTDGRALFLTVYTLCGDPAHAFDDMTVLRDKLYDGDRMRFPPEKKAVREGDVLSLRWAVPAPERTLLPEDVPFVGHTGLIVVQRRGDAAVDDWYRSDWAPRVVALDGVHGVASYSSATRDGLVLDLTYVEGDAGGVLEAIRDRAPHHQDVTLVVEAPFDRIELLRYPFAEAIRSSDLPRTVA